MNYDKASILKAYADSLEGRCPQYITHARRFLDRVSGFEREDIDQYIETLRQEEYSDGTINLIFRIIKRMFKVNNIPFPYAYRETPRVEVAFKPSLDKAVITAMIRAAKKGELNPIETFYLCMSTLYGLRAGELAALDSRDINIDNGTIFVHTLKGGRQKYHSIPEGCERWLNVRVRQTSTNRLARIYRRIERKVGMTHYEGVAWHAIRRTLVQELVFAGVNQYVITDFLRWSNRKTDLVGWYFQSQAVGMEGIKIGPGSRDSKSDHEVFAVHPFVKEWQDNAPEEAR